MAEYGARGLVGSFPLGRYVRDPRWAWLWNQVLFCTPWQEPTSAIVSGANNLTPLGMCLKNSTGEATDLIGGSANHPERGSDGPQFPGHQPLRFPGGTSATVGTAVGIMWVHEGGNTVSIPLGTPIAGSGKTIALIFRNRQEDERQRRVFGSIGSFPLQEGQTQIAIDVVPSGVLAIRAGATLISGTVDTLNQRLVVVFTHNALSITPRYQLYVNGALAGSSSFALPLLFGGGFPVVAGIRASTRAARDAFWGDLEMILITREYWSQELVERWTGEPFAFLQAYRRPRRLPAGVVIPEDPCDWFADQPAPDWAGPGGAPWLSLLPGQGWAAGQAAPDWASPASGDWFAPKEC